MIKTLFIVVHTFFIPRGLDLAPVYDDMFYMARQRIEVKTFETKDELSEFLKTKCVTDTCEVYEGKKLEFEVNIKKEKVKREVIDDVEIGREVILK